ncbi:MAG: ABC transporter ATP-binding protein/permease [Erysipelotrichaceae bacterium]|nr:ABC transporter ATP-binding protein/permease [Erysipelotrichaceae bacterium]
MLELKSIKKDYQVGDGVVHALKGLSFVLRKNEFVAILGPSGCGKTTLLNIIGGLDKATDGDLVINGLSTKHYKDRDWDVYRNHRIGFIFQSYNLIPHQNVLSNVELALTISGMGKEERIQKAKEALDRVGLSDKYYKKPNQLSGGQCQRVAIARALVNNPEILLADEPTGALDTTTSEQIMDLIAEIAKERLVIMVTHNSELAKRYANRTIRLLDGELVSDSNPIQSAEQARIREEDAAEIQALKVSKEKAKMSLVTSFKLSINNLVSKRRRSILTSIASSIGIIGISLVLAISYGVQNYINKMQNDMLAGYPITVSETTFDINQLEAAFTTQDQIDIVAKGDYVNISQMMEELYARFEEMDDFMIENNISKTYVDFLSQMSQDAYAALEYDYGLNLAANFYTDFNDSSIAYPEGRNTSLATIKSMYTSITENIMGFDQFSSLISMLANPFRQAPDTTNPTTESYMLSQYEVLYKTNETGIAKAADEIMIVVNKNREVTDLMLGQLGYYSQEEFVDIINRIVDPNYVSSLEISPQIAYETLTNKGFTYFPNDSIYTYTPQKLSGGIGEAFSYQPYKTDLTNGKPLKVVGILEPKEGLNYGMLASGFYYTSALAEEMIQENYDSEVAKYLRGTAPDGTTVTKRESLSGSVALIRKGDLVEYPSGSGNYIPAPADVLVPVQGQVISYTYQFSINEIVDQNAIGVLGSTSLAGLLSSVMPSETTTTDGPALVMTAISMTSLGGNVNAKIIKDDAGKILEWDIILEADGQAFPIPRSIAIYNHNFEQKELALQYLDIWNSDKVLEIGGVLVPKTEREDITYLDTLSLIFGMIKTVIDIVTIALIGFTSLALFVSCVMIAIITYISIVERTKEIGVIRSLGGRKKDVSALFVCETAIIGLAAGAIAIGFTYFASLIINLITTHYAGVTIAVFPWFYALMMLSLSILLTLVSGFIPSRSAAKKDPVEALRSE